MLDHRPLRPASRARGEDHVREIFRPYPGVGVGHLDAIVRERPVEQEDAVPSRTEPAGELPLRHDRAHVGVVEHHRDTVRRIGGIERHVGPARFQDAEEADHHLQRALDADSHQRLRSHTAPAQLGGDQIRPTVELTVCELRITEHHRDGVGSASDLSLDLGVHRARRAEGGRPRDDAVD